MITATLRKLHSLRAIIPHSCQLHVMMCLTPLHLMLNYNTFWEYIYIYIYLFSVQWCKHCVGDGSYVEPEFCLYDPAVGLVVMSLCHQVFMLMATGHEILVTAVYPWMWLRLLGLHSVPAEVIEILKATLPLIVFNVFSFIGEQLHRAELMWSPRVSVMPQVGSAHCKILLGSLSSESAFSFQLNLFV